MKLMKKQFMRVLLFLFFVTIGTHNTFASQMGDINANVINLHYDLVKNAIVFDLQIKAGNGYVTGTQAGVCLPGGQATGFNIRYDMHLEPGVTIVNPNVATDDPIYGMWTGVVDQSAYNMESMGVSSPPPSGLPLSSAIGLNIIRSFGANDMGTTYKTIATITLPLAPGSAIPTPASYIQQRLYTYTPKGGRSAWANSCEEGNDGAIVPSTADGKYYFECTTITGQPSTANQTQCVGGSFSQLCVTATSVGTITSYQWYENTTASTTGGTAVSGATNSCYTPSSATAGTSYYYCVITSTCDVVTSSVSGSITVNPATTITSQPSTTGQSICLGQSFTDLSVTATGTGLTYQWYSNTTSSTTGGIAISGATSSSYTPSSAAIGTNYYYCVVSSGGTCGTTSNVSGAYTVSVAPAITVQPSKTDQTQCLGQSFTALSVTATGTGLTYQWYSNTTALTTGGTAISGATSSTYTPSSATAGTLYYYCVITGSCGLTSTSTVSGAIVTNANIVITAQPSTAGQTQCVGGTFTQICVTATGSGTLSYQWYSNATASTTGGAAITGATSSCYTPSASVSGTIYYYCVVTATCGNVTSAVSGSFVTNAIPTITATTPGSNCGAGTVTLGATASAGTINWYAAATGGSSLGTGTSFTTPTISATTTYYVAATANGCTSATRTSVVASMSALPTPPVTTTPQSFCNTATVANLQATGSNVKWYTTSTGGTALAGTAALSTGIYYAAQSVGGACESASRSAVSVVVDNTSTPAAPEITSPQSLCAPATITNIATNGNANIVWYTTATGTTKVTGNLTNGTTYYAALEAGGCSSDVRTPVLINISATTPNAPVVKTPQSFCDGALINNINVPNNQIKWYTASTGGSLVSTGTRLTTGSYYAAQSAGSCESATRTKVDVSISMPATPVGPTSQTLCSGKLVADLQVTGSGVVWYKAATGTAAWNLTDALVNGTTYYAAQTSGSCESASRLAVTVSILQGGVNAPSAVSPQSFCTGATISNLQASGNGIKWYTSATGGILLAPTQTLSNNIIYYASQTVNGCESATRTAVTVKITTSTPSAPVISSPQSLCAPATFESIATDGNPNIIWYASATGGSALPASSSLASGSYYAAIKAGSCESATRTKVDITIGAAPSSSPNVTTPQAFCPGATIANITIPNDEIIWYDAATGGNKLTTETILPVGTTTYYAAQKAGGCESTSRKAVALDVSTASAPIAPSSQVFCSAATIADLQVSGSGISWYSESLGGMKYNLTDALATGTYYASQNSGNCEGARTPVNVVALTNGPTPPAATNPQSYCSTSATVSNLQAAGSNIKWYTSATGGTALAETTALTTGIYYASQTVGTCESVYRTAVSVSIDGSVPFVPALTSPQSLCGPATLANVLTNGNTNIVWYAGLTGGTALPLTTSIVSGTTYYAAIEAGSCKSATRTSVTVNISETTPSAPIVTTPQSFCYGAFIDNVSVPNNQIKWYTAATGGTVVPLGTLLTTGSYYAAQLAGVCESATRTKVDVSVSTFSTPVGPTTQTLCAGKTVADLQVTGSGIVWYKAAIGTAAWNLSDALVNGTTYYAAQTSGSCESTTRLAVKVQTTAPSAPIATSPQTFCGTPTVSDLQTAGTGVKWYTSAAGSTLATGNLIDGATYYASQTAVGGCESATRTAVKVNITTIAPAAPVVTSPQNMCSAGTIADIAIPTGTNIVWYSTATGGTALSTTTVLTSATTYYAAIKAGSCESVSRTPVLINLGTTPATPIVTTPQSFCSGATVNSLAVSNNQIAWYLTSTGGTKIPAGTLLATGTYYAAQTAGTCESAIRTAVTVNITTTSATPTAPTPQSFIGGTIADLQVTGSNIVWYADNLTTTVLPATTPLVNGRTYYAAQSTGICESPRTPVTVEVSATLALKVFLQGPTKLDGSIMTNYIQTPVQAYSSFNICRLPQTNPYGAPGSSYLQIADQSGPAGKIVDWLDVEIWRMNEGSRTILQQKALLLQVDGKVVDVDGRIPTFTAQTGTVRVIVKQRNHLSVMSQDITNFSGAVTYDFTGALTQAYRFTGDPAPMVKRGNTWCMWAGDLNGDGYVDVMDKTTFDISFRRNDYDQYIAPDLNMDGTVDIDDKPIMDTSLRNGVFSPVSNY